MCNSSDSSDHPWSSRLRRLGSRLLLLVFFALFTLLPATAAAQIARDSIEWKAIDDSGDTVTAKAVFELREIDPGGDSYYEFDLSLPPVQFSPHHSPSVFMAWIGEGAITVAVDDRSAYFAHLPFGSEVGPDRQALYTDPTGGLVRRHEPPETHPTAMAFAKLLLGTNPAVGTALGMAEVLDALSAGTAKTPSFGVTTTDWTFQEWSDTADVDDQDSDILATGEPEAPFTDDRVYDAQTYAWSELGDGGDLYVERIVYRFAVGREGNGPSALFLRALIPYLWVKDWYALTSGGTKLRYLEIEWKVPLTEETEEPEEDVAAGKVAIHWATEVVALTNVTNPQSNLLGPPDDRIVGLAGRADSEVTASGFGGAIGASTAITTYDASRLAAALGISADDLARADFFGLEYNGSPNAPFESSRWDFDDGTATATISHDFTRPDAGVPGIVKAGILSHSDVNRLFGITARSGSYAYLLFDVSSLGVDTRSSALRVTVTGVASQVGSPDPDAMGVLRSGGDETDEGDETPADAIAPPTDLVALFPGGTLRLEWTDNAVGESGVRIRVYRQGVPEAVGELLANATSWVSQYSLTTGREYTLDVCAFRKTSMGGEEVACSTPVTFTYGG